MAREINLIPDVKNEMVRALKLRNLIFFICFVVAIASVSAVFISGVIAGGQQIAIDGKNRTIEKLSEKLNSYSDLNDFLTIKDQLGNLSTLTENKQVISRTFNVLSALLPTGADTITVSELNVDLSAEQPTLSFEAQANAGQDPYIDYNVLDSFKKSMQYMRYDYGNYVDKEGNTIPAYCMIETGNDGAILSDSVHGIYALWTIDEEGCNPTEGSSNSSYTKEEYNGQQVVRIWRTPQFNDWYRETPSDTDPYMGLDGTIQNVPHFESACYTYSGDDSQSSTNPRWTENNENCPLVPGGNEGITISDSSNGRDSSDELVLRFSATILVSPEVYKFNNYHMLAIAPSGRRNVTDSYVQIQAMFKERAADCAKGDSACNTPTEGGNN